MATRFKSAGVNIQEDSSNLITNDVKNSTWFTLNRKSESSTTVPRHNQQSQTQTTRNFWQQLRQRWSNCNVKTKLIFLMGVSAAIPAIVGTTGVVVLCAHRLDLGMQESVQGGLKVLSSDLERVQQNNNVIATSTAEVIVDSGLDLKDKSDLKTAKALVKKIGQGDQSFRIIIDAHGKTVAQNIQILGDDFSDYPPINKPSVGMQYHEVSLPTGISLGNIAIVKDALSTGRLMSGYELWSGDDLARLGLDKQATLGFRSQEYQWLSKQDRPFEDATVFRDTDVGHAGLVLAAVQPIRVQGKIIGAVLVGTLLNRNFPIVDQLRRETGVETASLFAQDQIVATNIADPSDGGVSRAIGTKAASGVADAVVNRGQKFIGHANVLQDDFLIAYSPLLDHRQKPIGMAGVGDPQSKEFSAIIRLWVASLFVGGGVLLLAGIVAVPLASRFSRPIRQLVTKAQRISSGYGTADARLDTARADEFGDLSRQLNYLAEIVDLSQSTVYQTENLHRQTESQIESFSAVSKHILASLNLSDILKCATDEIRPALNAQRVLVYQASQGNQSGVIAAESVSTWHSNALAVEIESLCVPLEDIQSCSIKINDDFSVVARLVAPIMVNNQLFGWLIAHQDSRPWRQSENVLFKQSATTLGVAIEQALLLDQLENARITSELNHIEQQQQKEHTARQLVTLLNDVESFSIGDLTARAQVSTGEIGTIADFFNLAIEQTHQLVTQIKTDTDQLNSSVEKNALASAHLAQANQTQADEIKYLLNSVMQMTQTMLALTDDVRTAASLTRANSNCALASLSALNQAVDSISNFRTTVGTTADNLKQLTQNDQQMSRALFSLEQISLRSTILATNASLSAQRTGESGQAFANVATELSLLAASSTEVISNLKQIRDNIHTETIEIVAAIELSTTQVLTQTNLVDDNKTSWGPHFNTSKQIDHLVQSIFTSTSSQAQVFALMTNLMEQLAEKSTQTSNSSQQVSDSASQTLELAHQLQISVDAFKLNAER